jgi:hypothetical protein
VLLFAAAVGVLLAAHVVRAARHSLLFARGELPERFDLLLALSVGYVLNTLVPFRVGEAARALYIALRLRLRVAYVLATVAAERFSDVVVVAVIAGVLAASGGAGTGAVAARAAAAVLAGVAVLVVAGALLVQHVRRARRALWAAASVFNDSIRLGIVEFFATAAHLVTGGALFTGRYLAATAGMWALYLGAFELFARSAGLSLSAVSFALLGAPLRPLLNEAVAGRISPDNLALLTFTTIPVAVIAVYGFLRHGRAIGRSVKFVRRFGLMPGEIARPPVSRKFRNTSDYAAFLQAHFSAADQIVSTFVTEGTDDVVVHRLLPGGSDAVTAVVESGGTLTIRKLAAGGAGQKLGVQADWLRRHAAALPLPEVLGERRFPDRYHYDMPFTLSARDFYDVIHTAPVDASWGVLRDVVAHMDGFHRAHARGEAAPATVDAYLESKVRANARAVLDYATVVAGDEYTINGAAHRLSDWDCLLDLDWLRAQVRRRDTAVIHGDLTIENVIVCPERPRGWYLIDPNPENVLDTPLIDWAKLMQSLDLGYEGLNRGGTATVRRDGDGAAQISLAFTKSSAYARLEQSLTGELRAQLGPDGMREVAFHELVNYLRLTPYKIRHARHKAPVFFACTAVLLRRYRDTYGDDGRGPATTGPARTTQSAHGTAGVEFAGG